MDDSVSLTIEKIKLQEQDNEIKLREKREHNAAILSLNRSIHEATIKIDKLKKEHQTLINTTDALEHQLFVEKIRQNSLADQVNNCRKELIELQKASLEGISSVWQKRSKLFETVKTTSDKCDIWALLIKPTIEIKPQCVIQTQNNEISLQDNSKLKMLLDRRDKAITMRNFLLSEPDVGEEFIRTRNALQYSMEIMAKKQ